jgi:hypothetical protein
MGDLLIQPHSQWFPGKIFCESGKQGSRLFPSIQVADSENVDAFPGLLLLPKLDWQSMEANFFSLNYALANF